MQRVRRVQGIAEAHRFKVPGTAECPLYPYDYEIIAIL